MKPRNFVAKHLGVNHSQVFVDRKKETKAGAYKHQAMSELRKAYLEHKHMEELYSLDTYKGYKIGVFCESTENFVAEVYSPEGESAFYAQGECPEKLLEDCKEFVDNA